MVSRWQFYCFISLCILAFSVFYGQYVNIGHTDSAKVSKQPSMTISTHEIRRSHSIALALRQLETKNVTLMADIEKEKLHQKRPDWVDSSSKSLKSKQVLMELLNLTPMKGPGIEITLKDASLQPIFGHNPNVGIIHNTDLLSLVNDLRQAGAKAIAINNEPITPSTALTCTGPVIMVNQTRIAPPFKVLALGGSERLMNFLRQHSQTLHDLTRYGIQIQLEAKTVTIPAAAISEFSH